MCERLLANPLIEDYEVLPAEGEAGSGPGEDTAGAGPAAVEAWRAA
jgi:hypothetical protein